MSRRWITNTPKHEIEEAKHWCKKAENEKFFVGEPKSSKAKSSQELRVLGLVGLYIETSDTDTEQELKPDPNCRYCKGTGRIDLLISSKPCDCLQDKSPELIDIGEPFQEKINGIDSKYYKDYCYNQFIPKLRKIK